MSDTPRTDDQEFGEGVDAMRVDASFARILREQIRVSDVAFNHQRDQLAAAQKEIEKLKDELNWQNNRNSGHPTKGGFEFYVNEEWTGLAAAALDADYGWCAALRKRRIDPDDERVRIRRVAEDDQILKEIEELKRDRARLDWLESHCTVRWPYRNQTQLISDEIVAKDVFAACPKVREAIDAALAREKGQS